VFIYILSLFFLLSCGKWVVPPELAGQWETGKTKVTVRSESGIMKFHFISGSASIKIRINADKSVSGSVGTAVFETGKLKHNQGNSDKNRCCLYN
jgi:hypothetical protein